MTAPLHEVVAGLFVPLSEPRFLARAHERGADAVVLDLEDAVAASRKAEARAGLPAAVRGLGAYDVSVVLRVNADAQWLRDDVLAAAAAGVDALMLPKVQGAAALAALEPLWREAEALAGRPPHSLRLLALIESPAAVLDAAAIARASPRLAALVFGGEDYAAALGLPASLAALDLPAQQVALAARAAGLAAWGLPGSIAGLDEAAFAALAARARSLGYTGCLCIHPLQLAAARRGFAPSAAEVVQARAIVAAAADAAREGRAAVLLDGRMIDPPVLLQARATLRQAAAATR